MKKPYGSNTTIKPSTSVKLEQFSFDPKKAQRDSFTATLISGGLRMITGLLGQRSRDKFKIGVTDGSVEVTNPAGRVVLGAGQYSVVPRNQAPRPTANPGLVFTPPQAFSGPGVTGGRVAECTITR